MTVLATNHLIHYTTIVSEDSTTFTNMALPAVCSALTVMEEENLTEDERATVSVLFAGAYTFFYCSCMRRMYNCLIT